MTTDGGGRRSAAGAPVSVLIADDHGLMRDGVRSLVEALEGMRVVAEASDALQAISAARRLRPRLAIVDIRMPHANGVDAFVELRRWSPDTRIVVLTGISAGGLFAELIDLGVDGLFVKQGDPGLLSSALPRIAAGETIIDPQALALAERGRGAARLTPRELQVLQGIARGETNAAMAERLHISPKTVDSHRTQLMRKLGVSSAPALIGRAIADGLIEAPGDS